MITDLLIDAFGGVLTFLVGLLPDITLPTWVADLTGAIATGVSGMSVLAHWLPVTAMAHAASFLLLCTTVGWGVKLTRVAFGYFTGGST